MDKKNLRQKGTKGITLIALVITIVVMLILVAVTITMAVNGGLFEYAGRAGTQTNEAIANEQEFANLEANMTVNELIDKYTEGEKKEYIGTEKSYVGCYADFEGDGTIDGIIYADLAKGVSGTYYSTSYSKEAVTSGLKEYYVSKTDYEGTFGKDGTEVRDVITVVPDSSGVDRFYVMDLENVGGSSVSYCWYDAAYGNMSDYATATSVDFGKGQDNTTNMIAKWDKGSGEGGYGAQDDNGTYKDMWGQIKTQVANGWFVPSKGEWAAFADAFDITSSNCSNTYGLSIRYWSSSQGSDDTAWRVIFDYNGFGDLDVYYGSFVRLSATF